MKAANLYSLLSGKWFIHEEYGKSLLPSAAAILFGDGAVLVRDNTPEEEFVVLKSSATSSKERSASKFDNTNNDVEYVLVLDFKNPIYKYNQECGPRGTKHKMQIMQRLESDINMKGVVFDMDSGGGQVAGTPEFYDFVQNYSKPVVAYTDGYMCSACYYIGSAADHIVANKRAEAIGSIGTMISFVDMTGIIEKKGGKVITEYATKSTEKNKDFEELISGNSEPYIKNVLDPITDTFHTDIKSVRPSIDEKCLAGGTWNGIEAQKVGLVDEIGTLQTAIDKVFELSNSNTTTTQQKTKNMNTENLQQVLAVLGVEELHTNENGVYLNEEQLQAFEQRLTENAQAITDAQQAQQTAEDNLATAQANETALVNAIDAACEASEIENLEEMTATARVEALQNMIAEYGDQPGATGTRVPAKETQGSGNKNIVGGMDISAAMNN